jgi:pSer/pThr/pTyr-binding forkhead associated (FHA) protein
LTIGRVTTADFSISSDAHMSRNHLIVEGLGHSFRLRDIGSSNGTFVNDFKVSMVELCHGDRIKAGTSVFEVGLENDGASPASTTVEPHNDEQMLANIPARTLAGQEVEQAIEELTMRYEAPASDPAELMTMAPEQNARPPENAWGEFFDEFISLQSLVWEQRTKGQQAASRILEKLLQSNVPALYTLIVNRQQLDGFEKGTLDFVLSTRESRALTETLCLVESHKPSNNIEFYKRCMGKDAAVCVVSSEPLSAAWLHGAIDVLSYPSLLADVVQRSSSRARELTSQVHFILFEPHAGGELRLLRSLHAGAQASCQ